MNDLVMSPDDKVAYVKAQKQRNLYIGLGLFVFVLLVFGVSLIRMTEGIANDRAAKQAASGLSNVPAEAKVDASANPKP